MGAVSAAVLRPETKYRSAGVSVNQKFLRKLRICIYARKDLSKDCASSRNEKAVDHNRLFVPVVQDWSNTSLVHCRYNNETLTSFVNGFAVTRSTLVKVVNGVLGPPDADPLALLPLVPPSGLDPPLAPPVLW